ncbi:peptide/nickel transport system permease protein [Stackebrandtia albiflava]|uniref:Peptide/nickel transport system permease protein n=1 Tax=Stackebrandtia albiflava TaxID=406432 RepID=A0A562UPT1_9ACTN|nr:ABC transporter permease [Stackebrandtia albiflava]TWJ07617.1 peptide/nickel transport system permease protein [Stackebrandtia albiflava]
MLRFIIRRLLLAVLTLTMVSIITFGLFFAVPADPARLQCGQRCTAEQVDAVRANLGLDEPVHEQYVDFVKGIFVGRSYDNGTECGAPCLGLLNVGGREVTEVVADALPITASIAVGAWLIQMTLGIGLGAIAAIKRGRFIDKFAVGASLVGAATPLFFFGPMLLLIFRYELEWLPQPAYVSPLQSIGDWMVGMILPWLAVSLIGFAFETRMTRSQMLETLDEDFIRTSWAKGLRGRTVFGRHALRASITPIATSAGLSLAGLLGGAVVTETIFGLNGLGKRAVDAVRALELSMVMATVLIAALFIVVSTLLVDLLYAVIDPRVRLS